MRRPAVAVMAVLTVGFLALGGWQAERDSLTVDEGPDLVASVVTVAERDLRLNPEHGALFHLAAGVLPVLLADPLLPDTEAYRDGDWFDYTEDVISANEDAGRLDAVVFWFRVAPLLAGAAVGWVLFALGRRLGGDLAGLLAGGLWMTTPYVLGLSHVGSLDVAFALAVAGLVLAIVRDRERPTPGRVLAVAVVVGLALVTRHVGVVLVPVALGFVVLHRVDERRNALRAAVLVLVVPVAVAWGVHRSIDPTPVDGPPRARFDGIIATASANGPLERLVLAVPMPVEWRAGFGYLALTSEPRPAYLLGATEDGSRPWFFPVTAAIKLPVSFTLAVAAGALVLARRRRVPPVVWAAAVAGAVVFGFLLVQPLNLGLRLAMPLVALIAIPAAGLAELRGRAGAITIGVLAVIQVGSTFAAHPTSLAWTPPPFSDGYRYLSDSSIDYGQAHHAVREEHEEEPFVAASLVSPRGIEVLPDVPGVVGAEAEDLVGRVAVGATALTVVHAQQLSWLRAYCPVDVLDGAVLVYRFMDPPDVRPGSGIPPAPCPGSVSERR